MQTKILKDFLWLSASIVIIFCFSRFSVFESNEALAPTILSGSVTQGKPLTVFYYTSHFLLCEIYMKLYETVKGVPWFEVFMYFYAAISLFFILKVLFIKNKSIAAQIFTLLPVLFFFSEFTLIFQYTRIAFALGIAGSLLMLSASSDIKFRKFFAATFFVVALLTRWEVGILILLLQWLYILCCSRSQFKNAVLWGNTLAVIILLGYVAYDRSVTTEYTKKFQPELGYQLLDRGNIIPLSSMANAVDSAKYNAVLQLISDPQYITIDFLKGLVKENAYTGFNSTLWTRCFSLLGNSAENASGFLLIYLLLIAAVLYQQQKSNAKFFSGVTVFCLLAVVLLMAITYFLKMEMRLFNSVIIFASIILLWQINFSAIVKQKYFFALLLIGWAAGIVLQKQIQTRYVSKLIKDAEQNTAFKNAVTQKCGNRIIVPDIQYSQNIIQALFPAQMPDYAAFKNIYLFDFDVMYLEQNYNKYLREQCNCDAGDYKEMMDFFRNNKREIDFIASPERLQVITAYCRTVRQADYRFMLKDSVDAGGIKAFVYCME